MKIFVKTLTGKEIEMEVDTERTIVKSEKDPRSYKYIVLENGLRVTLISDPRTKQAAAAMSVHVGSEDDPAEFQGLSHLLEHSLFLGSTKYPDRNAYSEFVESHGGSNNAVTTPLETIFFFDVTPASLREGCDIFSQLFIDPLFDEELVRKEITAIDEEFKMSQRSPCVRLNAVLREIAKPDSAFKQFSIGNSQTLKGELLLPALKKHYSDHYSAPNMTLAITGTQSLEELESIVRECFSAIKPVQSPERLSPQGCPIETGKLVSVSSFTASQRQLSILWPVPELRALSSTQPSFYVANMLNRTETDSLHDRLWKRGLIESINFGRDISSRHFSFVVVTAQLTDYGFERYKWVVQEVFEFLRGLDEAGIPDWFWPEFQTTSDMHFDRLDEDGACNRVITLATDMAFIPPESLLTWNFRPTDYNPEAIAQLMAQLTPENAIQVLVGPGLEGKVQTEQYFGIKYRVEPAEERSIEPFTADKLPGKNPFIPTDLQRRAELLSEQPKPERLEPLYTSRTDLWFQPEIIHNEPVATVRWSIPIESMVESFETRAMAFVYASALMTSLNSELGAARRCVMQFGVSADALGIAVYINGFAGSVISLAESIFERISTFDLTHTEYNLSVDERLVSCERAKDCGSTSMASRNAILFTNCPVMSCETEERILCDLTFKKLSSSFTLKKGCFRSKITCLAAGDLSREDAYRLAELAEEKLQPLEWRSSIIPRIRTVKLPRGTTRLYHAYPSDNEEINALTILVQTPGGDLHRTLALLHVFKALGKIGEFLIAANENAHDTLRTEEQLCYYVQLGGWAKCGGGVELSIQIGSEKYSPEILEERVDVWLKSLLEFFATLPQERFQACIDSTFEHYNGLSYSNFHRRADLAQRKRDESMEADLR